MTIYLDKTTPKRAFLRDDLPLVLFKAIPTLKLALQKTPIYYSGSRRVSPTKLVEEAKAKISRFLNKHNLSYVILSEQEIKKHFPEVKSKDRLDLLVKIVVEEKEWILVIEFDSARADQVAKKFLSRVAQIPNSSLIYIAFCYSGTEKMSLNEVKKYFSYMEFISKNLGLAGFVGMIPPRNRGDVHPASSKRVK